MLKSPLGRPARTVNMVQLGKALTELDDPPVKALVVYNSNPAAVCPDQNLVRRGLKRDDLFTVVHEQFLTDTTDFADMVLPATTFFEQKDLVQAYGHYYLQVSQPAIEPLGECKSNVEFFRELALRMGFEDECFREPVDTMIDAALQSGAPQLKGITRQRLESDPYVRLNLHGDDSEHPWLPFANGFDTPNRKARLFDPALIAHGMDPVASFVAPEESRHRRGKKQFPLELLARKADNFLNSTFVNLPSLQKMERPAGTGNQPCRRAVSRHSRWRPRPCLQPTRRDFSACTGRWRGGGRRRRGTIGLGEVIGSRPQHQCADFGPAHRSWWWRYVLFHPG